MEVILLPLSQTEIRVTQKMKKTEIVKKKTKKKKKNKQSTWDNLFA